MGGKGGGVTLQTLHMAADAVVLSRAVAVASLPERRGNSRQVSGGGQVVQLCSPGDWPRLLLPLPPSPRWLLGTVGQVALR